MGAGSGRLTTRVDWKGPANLQLHWRCRFTYVAEIELVQEGAVSGIEPRNANREEIGRPIALQADCVATLLGRQRLSEFCPRFVYVIVGATRRSYSWH